MAQLLIVDDDADICFMLADALRGEGHTVRIAADGKAGLAALQERATDLVLLDVEMPILDGPNMAYRMFIQDCGMERIPIILISGVFDLAGVAAAVGTPYYLGKPFEMSQLTEMIARARTERVAPVPRRGDPS